MSWVQDLASFAKRLLTLEGQVESNAEEIKALRQDLKALTEFTQKVAYAVKRNQERAEDKHKNLVLSLKVELLELERRLSTTNKELGQTLALNDGDVAHPASGLSDRESAP